MCISGLGACDGGAGDLLGSSGTRRALGILRSWASASPGLTRRWHGEIASVPSLSVFIQTTKFNKVMF